MKHYSPAESRQVCQLAACLKPFRQIYFLPSLHWLEPITMVHRHELNSVACCNPTIKVELERPPTISLFIHPKLYANLASSTTWDETTPKLLFLLFSLPSSYLFLKHYSTHILLSFGAANSQPGPEAIVCGYLPILLPASSINKRKQWSVLGDEGRSISPTGTDEPPAQTDHADGSLDKSTVLEVRLGYSVYLPLRGRHRRHISAGALDRRRKEHQRAPRQRL